MAFCPNCGTPNTEQAAKCVSCGFELAPAQKAKFKGTIMMGQAVQAPQQPPQAGQQAAPPQSSSPAPSPSSPAAPSGQAGPRNMAFEKTMLGPMGGSVQVPPLAAPPPAADPRAELGRAATVEGPAPQFTPPPQSSASGAPAAAAGGYGAASTGAGYATGGVGGGAAAGYGGGGGGYDGDDGAPPAALPKPNTGKILAIGCAVVLVMSCLIGGVMYFMAKKQLSALMGSAQDETATLAWRGTLSQALGQVSALCASNCEGAANYFHPSVQAALLGQAKQLTPERLAKLVDPAQSPAAMLNTTDDGAIATNLGLDPQLCVRIAGGNAKVVGCSVPNPSGPADMRIVHLSGLESL
ncbi:MAG: zinc ribbon domain-containing protein [Myxococcales bacterium]